MGWLRELMAQAGVRSFGELARQALAHPDWPTDTRAQPRSLEAILGRLDRREDLDWLTDRPGIQQVLASLLKSQVAEIRSVLLSAATPKSLLTRLRLDDLPTARALDLQQEALPPTIPECIGLPATWKRLVWVGESGSGFTLAKHWLLARGLAQPHTLENIEEYRSLPVQGPPLFLEVAPELCESILSEFAQTQAVCLAVASSPHKFEALFARFGFELTRSAPLASSLERIVDWVIARSTHGCQSRRDALLSWLNTGPLAWGTLETLGDTLGFAGAFLVEEPHSKVLDTKEAFLRQWFSARTAALAHERLRDNSAMGRLLPEALIDIAQATLLDDTRPLLSPRSLEDWLELVPPQHQRGPDLDWLTAQVSADPQTLRPRDIERAAKRLPPGAHRIVVALRELSLLRPSSATQFALRPHFVARLLHSIAKDRTLRSQPIFWGEALLKPSARNDLLDALAVRVAADPEAIAEDLLEVVEAESAPLVSALETCFVLLGLELLAGGELSESTTVALLEEQNAILLTGLGPLPQRRTAPTDFDRLADSEGAFYLSAFALSEQPRKHRIPILPLLDPWSQTEPLAGWGLVLNAVTTTVQSALLSRPRWLRGALRLLDRLRQVIGSDVEHRHPQPPPHQDRLSESPDALAKHHHPLFCPAILLDAVELSVLEAAELHDLLEQDWQFELLLATVDARGKNANQVLSSLWSVLSDAGDADTQQRFLAKMPATFWSDPPTDLLVRLLLSADIDHLPIPWQELPIKVWTTWSQHRARINAPGEPIAPWKSVPNAIGEPLARTAPSLSPRVRDVAWERWPEVGIYQIERNRTLHPAVAMDWLASAPPSATEALAAAATQYDWHKADTQLRVAIVKCLHRGVGLRMPGWAAAYDCLHRFECERQRFESLSR